MADKKISQLTGATTPLAGTEEVPLVQSGATKKVSVANLTAGRSVSASELTATGANARKVSAVSTNGDLAELEMVSTGNNTFSISSDVVMRFKKDNVEFARFTQTGNLKPIAANGVDYSANTPAAGMTSQLLNWYEEGTWTPTVTAGTGTITSVTSASGKYTRIGRVVSINCTFVITTNGTGASYLIVDGLPFTVSNAVPSTGYNASDAISLIGSFGASSTQFNLFKYDGTYPGASGKTYYASGVYYV